MKHKEVFWMVRTSRWVQLHEKGISGSTLKWIAIVTMLIDHIGAVLVNQSSIQKWMDLWHINEANQTVVLACIPTLYISMRMIGRIAFPIFCFLLIEGFVHTRDIKKYATRLGIFAFISEIPFDLAISGQPFYWQHNNVFFTLFLGVCVMSGLRWVEGKEDLKTFQKAAFQGGIIGLGMYVAACLHTDYSWMGILCITLLYMTRHNKRNQIIMGCAGFSFELPALLAFIPIGFYNGKRGRQMKYLFYAFYPVHLLILSWL